MKVFPESNYTIELNDDSTSAISELKKEPYQASNSSQTGIIKHLEVLSKRMSLK